MSTHPISCLHLFPSEIWSECWTHCSTRQLRRLSLVCRCFHTLCLPLLFRSQTFDASPLEVITLDDWMERLHRLHRTALRLEKITEGPPRLMVHFWRFRARHRLHRSIPNVIHMHMVDSMYERVVASFFATLRLYERLLSLDLSHVTIDRAVRDALSALPMLEDLKLFQCDIVPRDGSLIGLKSFSITGTVPRRGQESEPLRLTAAHHLCSLHIHSSRDVPSILAGFGSQKLPQLFALSSAPSNAPDVTQFFAFLKQCEVLETLMVPMRYFDTAMLSSASWDSNTIPRLKCLTAPLDLIPIFTRNRPVTSVTVLHHQHITPEQLLQLLFEVAQTSAAVRSLTLPTTIPSGEAIDTITSLFPKLRELSIEIDEEDPPMSYMCRRELRSPNATPPLVDGRVPKLCDETAFNDLPDEEVSDVEEEECALPTPVLIERSAYQEIIASPTLQNVLNWICGNLHPLPAEIELLRLSVPDTNLDPKLSLSDEHNTIASLSSLYPGLREIRIGSTENHWDRSGALWKRRGAAEYIQVE
ncbi:hypothetical protein C8R43DRAFT_167967 [Mycena crocata]|nr:hypothetical protein C8R43DRAFT_167967 [Mycena crocata]